MSIELGQTSIECFEVVLLNVLCFFTFLTSSYTVVDLFVSQQKIQKQQVWGGSTTVKKQVSGTASSVAFTPLQVNYGSFIIGMPRGSTVPSPHCLSASLMLTVLR